MKDEKQLCWPIHFSHVVQEIVQDWAFHAFFDTPRSQNEFQLSISLHRAVGMMHLHTLLLTLAVIMILNASLLHVQADVDLDSILADADASDSPPSFESIPPPPRGPPEESPEEKAAKEAAEETRNAERLKKKGKKSNKDWAKLKENDLEKDWEKGDSAIELEHEYDHSQKVIDKKQKLIREEMENKIKLKEATKKKTKGKEKGKAEAARGGKGKRTLEDLAQEEPLPPFDINDKESVQRALREQARRGGPGGMGNIGSSFGQMGGMGGLDSMTGTAMYFVDLWPTQPDDGICKNPGMPWDKKAVDDMAGYWSSMLKSAHLAANVYNLGAHNLDGQMLLSVDKGWQTTDILKFVTRQKAVKKLNKDNREYTAAMFRDDDDDEL